MIEVYAHERATNIESLPSIFLAGPSPRKDEHYDWRPEALDHLKKQKFDGFVFIPLPRDGKWLPNWDAQAEWEVKYLDLATIIVFWVPRDMEQLPGLTTNIEFGLYASSGRSVLGYPPKAPYMRYLHFTADRYKIPVFHTMEETLNEAIRRCCR